MFLFYTIIVEITPKSLDNKNGLSVTDPVSRQTSVSWNYSLNTTSIKPAH